MSDSFDQQFIDEMIPHHESAIEMANLALERAEHPELKDLAGQIIKSQGSQIDQMRTWRREWFGSDSSRAMHGTPGAAEMEMGHSAMGGMMEMRGMVEGLRTAQPFDKAFLEEMVPHHGSAIEMAEDAQKRAEHPEIKQLADEIVTAQRREIATMEGWLRDWY